MTYLLSDWQGSTRAIVSNGGFVKARMDYTAYGEAIQAGVGLRTSALGYSATSADSLRQRYGLTERDSATGLDHTWFRKNENRSGRWTSPDPYNGSMLVSDPQSFNRNSYVQGQPTNFIDPSGLLKIQQCTKHWVWDSNGYRTWIDGCITLYDDGAPVGGANVDPGDCDKIDKKYPNPPAPPAAALEQFNRAYNVARDHYLNAVDAAQRQNDANWYWGVVGGVLGAGAGIIVGEAAGGLTGAAGGTAAEPGGGTVIGFVAGVLVGGIVGGYVGYLAGRDSTRISTSAALKDLIIEIKNLNATSPEVAYYLAYTRAKANLMQACKLGLINPDNL